MPYSGMKSEGETASPRSSVRSSLKSSEKSSEKSSLVSSEKSLVRSSSSAKHSMPMSSAISSISLVDVVALVDEVLDGVVVFVLGGLEEVLVSSSRSSSTPSSSSTSSCEVLGRGDLLQGPRCPRRRSRWPRRPCSTSSSLVLGLVEVVEVVVDVLADLVELLEELVLVQGLSGFLGLGGVTGGRRVVAATAHGEERQEADQEEPDRSGGLPCHGGSLSRRTRRWTGER